MSEPNGCRWCGVGEREHASRFVEPIGQHVYAAPSDVQRLERMTTNATHPKLCKDAGHEIEEARDA